MALLPRSNSNGPVAQIRVQEEQNQQRQYPLLFVRTLNCMISIQWWQPPASMQTMLTCRFSCASVYVACSTIAVVAGAATKNKYDHDPAQQISVTRSPSSYVKGGFLYRM